MITLFTCPKAFNGLSGIHQKNAIGSWLQIPETQVILLGNDQGAAQYAQQKGIMHLHQVSRNEFGTPLLNDIFSQAQESTETEVLCYLNADIVLMPEFAEQIQQVQRQVDDNVFLLVGRRYTMEQNELIDFSSSIWRDDLRKRIDPTMLDSYTATDYFVFPKGTIELPAFAIGRPAWDNWTLWDARQRGAMIIDATAEITAIHQKHDYRHVKEGINNTWEGPESEENRRLAGGYRCMCNILDATHLLVNGKIIRARTPRHIYRILYQQCRRIKHFLQDMISTHYS